MNKIFFNVICLIVGFAIAWVIFGGSNGSQISAVPGGQLIEQYDPYVMYNGGVKTELPLFVSASTTVEETLDVSGATILGGTLTARGVGNFTNTLGVGTSTPSFEFGVMASSGTSTIIIGTETSSRGSCIQLKATDGKNVRIYASTTPPAAGITSSVTSGIIIEAGACE